MFKITYCIVLLTLLFSCTNSNEKSINKTEKKSNQENTNLNFNRHNLDLIDNSYTYVRDSSSTELFYSILKVQQPKGILFLLPPTAQTVDEVIAENTRLANLAAKNNIITVIPSVNYNLYLDDFTISIIDKTLREVCQKHKVSKDKIIFGGFSLGGMNAIRYTEMAYQNDSTTFAKPAAVYGIDPPLDLERLYYAFQNTIERNFSKPAVQEATSYLQKIDYFFKGSPEENQTPYIENSMYSKSQDLGGNTQYLRNVPIRIYSDPDINWHLKERQNDMYGMNALDQTAMINQLQLLGNKKAELITALGKGKRLDGRRHPHSWNIAEPQDLVDWMNDLLD